MLNNVKINILFIYFVPLMIIIPNTFQVKNVDYHDQFESIDNEMIKNNLTKFNNLRKYCNFLDDIEINDENQFDYCNIDLELKKILVLIRHGDRGPLKIVRNLNQIQCNVTHLFDKNRYMDEKLLKLSNLLETFLIELKTNLNNSINDGCQPGLLTKFGLSQHIKLGLLLNHVYNIQLNWINNDDNDDDDIELILNQIQINTTPYPRTIQSALAFIYGFLNGDGGKNIDQNKNLIIKKLFELMKSENNTNFKQYKNPYFCDYQQNDKYCFNNCTEMDELLQKIYSTFNDYHNKNDEMKILIEKIEMILMPTNSVNNVGQYKRSIISIFDTLNTYICHKQNLPCQHNQCINIEEIDKIYKFIINLGHILKNSEQQHCLSWMQSYGFLLNFIEQIENFNEKKLILFSGHDLTIHAITNVFGFMEPTIPSYASRLIFEIYELKQYKMILMKEKFIRIIYNGNDVTELFPLCQSIVDDNLNDQDYYNYQQREEHCIRFDRNQNILLIKLSSLKNFIHTKFVEHYLFKNC